MVRPGCLVRSRGVHVVLSVFTWFDRGFGTFRNCRHAIHGLFAMFTWFHRGFLSVHVVFAWCCGCSRGLTGVCAHFATATMPCMGCWRCNARPFSVGCGCTYPSACGFTGVLASCETTTMPNMPALSVSSACGVHPMSHFPRDSSNAPDTAIVNRHVERDIGRADIVTATFRYPAAPLHAHVVHPTLKGRTPPVHCVGQAAGHMERPAPAGNLRNAGRADISNATSRYRAAPLYTHGVRPCTVSSRHFPPDIVNAAFRYLAAPLQTHGKPLDTWSAQHPLETGALPMLRLSPPQPQIHNCQVPPRGWTSRRKISCDQCATKN